MLPFSNLAHTPNFNASLGQFPWLGVGVGFGFGFGFGRGLGTGKFGKFGGQMLQLVTTTKNIRLTNRKRYEDLESIAYSKLSNKVAN